MGGGSLDWMIFRSRIVVGVLLVEKHIFHTCVPFEPSYRNLRRNYKFGEVIAEAVQCNNWQIRFWGA